MNQNRDMDSRCRAEVVELHQFFEDWFVGNLSGDASFERLSRVIADGFEIISPEGRKSSREAILDGVRNAHRQQAGSGFESGSKTTRAAR